MTKTPVFPSKTAKSLLLSSTLSSSPLLIPDRPRSQIPGHYSQVPIPSSLLEQPWSQEGERTLARWQTWCLVTAEALDPVSLSRLAWVAWATGCHEPAWPICARQGEPYWHSLILRCLRFCPVFLHSNDITCGLLMGSFTGKLKIPLNA